MRFEVPETQFSDLCAVKLLLTEYPFVYVVLSE